MRTLLFSLMILLCFSVADLSGQTEDNPSAESRVKIQHVDSEIIFDGIPDEKAWQSLEPFRMVMFSPYFGKDPSEKSDVRMGYDEEYLYAGARLNYADPGMIRSASFKRDFMGMGGDFFGIILDTYNDKENALAFYTSPDALRWDASILKDAVTSQPDQLPFNLSWNTFWDVLTSKDSTGWYAEIRIPLSSLRFQETDNEVIMGLIIHRWMPAKNESDIYPAIPPTWGQSSTMKPSQAQEILFEGIKAVKPLYIAPYALAGFGSNYDLSNDGDEYLKTDKPVFEAGLDVKYGISGNVVADLTVNTDFAQVEVDDQQFNLTRFSLYFPEKRMFFLERASIFDFALGGYNNLFYSRRIGLSEDGDPIRIYGGARITGRVGKWDLGFLDMQTAPLRKNNSEGISEEILPSENFGVLRVRKQVINENSYVGSMVTSRLGADGTYNIAYGIDGIFRLFGEDYLDIKWSQSFENGVTATSFGQPSRFMAIWERRSQKGLGYDFGYSYSGTAYNPGIGFEMINDYSVIRGGIGYGIFPGEKSKVYRHSPEYQLMYMNYVEDGSLMTMVNMLGWTIQTKNQSENNIFLIHNVENLKDSLEIYEERASVPPGSYNFLNIRAILTTPMSRSFYIMSVTETGQYFDGLRFSTRLQPTWNISKHLELGLTYSFDHVNFIDRNQKMTNHIAGFKGVYMLNTKFSVNAYIQYNTAVNQVNSNLRIRYNPKEGNDLYLVFNEGRNTNLDNETPPLPGYSTRAVLLKYTYTFNL